MLAQVSGLYRRQNSGYPLFSVRVRSRRESRWGHKKIRKEFSMINFKQIVDDFWNYVSNNGIEIYNEFSLQFELGIFLRSRTELKNYKIQFERNISYFGINSATVKHEIDIVIFNADKSEKYAIELKFPQNGQVPEQMYSFVRDIVFMEQLKLSGFTDTYVLTVANDRNFWQGKSTGEDIYKYFRNIPQDITGKVFKPTGQNKRIEYIEVHGVYLVQWADCCLGKYYFIKTL